MMSSQFASFLNCVDIHLYSGNAIVVEIRISEICKGMHILHVCLIYPCTVASTLYTCNGACTIHVLRKTIMITTKYRYSLNNNKSVIVICDQLILIEVLQGAS